MKKKLTLAEVQAHLMDLLQFVHEVCQANQIEYWMDGGTLLGAIRHHGFIPWDDDLDICVLYKDYDKLLRLLATECSQHPHYFLFFYSDPKLENWCEYLADSRVLAYGILPVRLDITPVKTLAEQHRALDESFVNVLRAYQKGKIKDVSKIIPRHQKQYLPIPKKEYLKTKQSIFNDFYTFLNAQAIENTSSNKIYNYIYNDMLVQSNRTPFREDIIFPLKQHPFGDKQFFVPNQLDPYIQKLYGASYMQLPPKAKQKPYSEEYFYSNQDKKTVIRNTLIFQRREDKHFFARSRPTTLGRVIEKGKSFVEFSVACIQQRAFKFWFVHLRFLIIKTIWGGRF